MAVTRAALLVICSEIPWLVFKIIVVAPGPPDTIRPTTQECNRPDGRAVQGIREILNQVASNSLGSGNFSLTYLTLENRLT